MNTAQSGPIITTQGFQHPAMNANHVISQEELRKLRQIYNLGVVEVVLGSLSMIVGIILLFVGISLAEGIWCGFFIVLAGGFGIPAGKPTSTKCMVFTHMALAIVGALFAATMFSLSMIYTFHRYYYAANVALHATLNVMAFIAMVIQIVSACYCCCVKDACNAQSSTPAQVIVVQQPQTMPVMQTGVAGVTVYHQQAGPMQQPVFVSQQVPMYSNQAFQQDEKTEGISSNTNPPAYGLLH